MDSVKVLLVQTGGPDALLLSTLSRYGLRVVVGGSAAAALEIASRVAIRSIVADYRLSDRSGVWLLEQVRAKAPAIQRILVTDEPRLDLERLRDNGVCHGTLRRPFDPGRLLDLLAGVPIRTDLDVTPIVSP